MLSIHSTVLIIGATSGIGAGLARSIHAQGKVVIATGRRQDRLNALKAELPGLQTSCFDISDITLLPNIVSGLTSEYPELDTVILCAGVQSYFSIKDASSTSPDAIEKEITINTTAPIVLCHLLVPFFLSNKRPASIIIFGSGLAFVPLPFLPLYGPTKSAIHSFSVALRAGLVNTNVRVTELSPPYVDTELDKAFKEQMVERLGGPDKAPVPMSLEEYVQKTMEGLEMGKEEIGVGYGELALQVWRNAFGPFLDRFHVEEGTLVNVPTLNIMMDGRVFKEPHNFNPDRWIQPDSSALLEFFHPFSLGPRSSIGRNFAWMGMNKTRATLCRLVEVRRLNDEAIVLREGFFVKSTECCVRLRQRP